MEHAMLRTHPAVFAVEDEYQIMVGVKFPCLMWVQVGGETFYDESNGILRSNVTIHRMHVPAKLLNEEKGYTLCWRKIIDRRPYFPETKDTETMVYTFRAPNEQKTLLYHISDAHNMVDAPVAACRHFEAKYGKIDILVLNGDIPNHSGDISYFDTVYEIVSQLTEGEIPTIFSRGNHDMRGFYAESFAEYTPNWNGNTFYTVRVGNLGAILLDCGEDKEDGCKAYGYTICCHSFRKRQSQWLHRIAEEKLLEKSEIQYKLVISHNPFSVKNPNSKSYGEDFDIEKDVYAEWCSVLKNEIRPDLMLAGHFHQQFITFPGDEKDDYLGHPSPVAVCCIPCRGNSEKNTADYYCGMGFVFEKGTITCCSSDSDGVLGDEIKI